MYVYVVMWQIICLGYKGYSRYLFLLRVCETKKVGNLYRIVKKYEKWVKISYGWIVYDEIF